MPSPAHAPHQDPIVHAAHAMPGAHDPVLAAAWLAIAVSVQYALIWYYVSRTGSRFASLYMAGGLRRLLVHLLKAPATSVHELAHFIMCKLTSTPTGKVVLWHPEVTEDRYVRFGYVQCAPQGPVQNVLVSLAPGILIPPALALYGWALTGSALPSPHLLAGDPPLQVVLWIIGLFVFTSSAFPSSGDFELLHFGHWLTIIGSLALITATVVIAAGPEGFVSLLAHVVALLTPAMIVAALFMLVRSQGSRRL
jgi:hypothetical protein